MKAGRGMDRRQRLTKMRVRLRAICAWGLLVWTGLILTPVHAQAAAIAEMLRTPIVSRLLKSTVAAEYYGIHAAENSEFVLKNISRYKSLETDLNVLGKHIARERGMRVVRGEKADLSGILSPEEEALVDQWRNLRFEPAPTLEIKPVQFNELPRESTAIAPGEFDALPMMEPLVARTGTLDSRLALRAEQSFGRRLKNYWQGMGTCLRTTPLAAQAESQVRQFLVSAGSSELITVVVYFGFTDKEKQSFYDLGMDMFMNIVRYGTRSKFTNPQNSFSGMYWSMVFVNGTMNSLDAGLYRLADAGSESKPNKDAKAYKRHLFNQAWSLTVSDWLGPSLYRIGEGLKCLHPSAKVLPFATTAGYLAVDTLATIGYYLGRQEFQISE